MRSRCDQVIQELGSSAGPIDPAVAEHLASCPDCAAWAEDDASLLRAWHASRPAEPAPEVWDALWARVSTRLDAARPDVLVLPERHQAPTGRVRPSLVALGLAQAAAILVAAWWFFPGQPSAPKTAPSVAQSDDRKSPATLEFTVEAGPYTLISESGGKWRKIEVASNDSSNQADEIYNHFEGMAENE